MKRNNLQGQVVRLETEKLHLENEIERLNDIINELEKELKFQRKCCLGLDNKFGVSLCDVLLNKSQALKGDE